MRTHPTDFTPTELNFILPNMPILEPHPRRKWTYKILLNAIYYVFKDGIQLRMVPVNFPPWPGAFATVTRMRRTFAERIRFLTRTMASLGARRALRSSGRSRVANSSVWSWLSCAITTA